MTETIKKLCYTRIETEKKVKSVKSMVANIKDYMKTELPVEI